MEFLNVVAAALGAFAFGAVWYMSLSKPWMAAADIQTGADGRPVNSSSKAPFIVGILAMILVAGMMRHTFMMSGLTTVGSGLVAGAGFGAFIVMPWVAMNYAFSMRKPQLTIIDGGNVIIGSAIMGTILNLF